MSFNWLAIYTYFVPFPLFKDACSGTLTQRTIALKHNKENSVHLPVYINRWSMITTIVLALTCLTKTSVFCNALFGMLFTCSFVFVVWLCVLYLLFCHTV